MKTIMSPPLKLIIGSAALTIAFLALPITARANVYATDIQINGTLTSGATSSVNTAATITYRLNENATAGVTVNVLSNSTVVNTMAIASPNAGTLQGSNSVTWTPTHPGTYSVSITAAAIGFTNWTQTSPISTNSTIVFPHGLAVDCNSNSPYYGRIMAGCPIKTSSSANGVTQKTGIYKYNADFTPADEGGYGYGQYTTDDSGDTASGQMATDGVDNPFRLKVGDDDRLYMLDWTGDFAVVSFDMQMNGPGTTVINENNYSGNPYFSQNDINAGNFDITGIGTTNAAVWMYNNNFDVFGVWYWHLVNGVADPNDVTGTWAITCDNSTSDLSLLPSGGGMADTNLDIFVSQYRLNTGDVSQRTMMFPNFNGGNIFSSNPTGGEFGQTPGETTWQLGTADNTMTGVEETVINSRAHPTLVALPMNGFSSTSGNDNNVAGGYVTTNGVSGYNKSGSWNGGIRLVNALNAHVSVKRGTLSGTTLTLNCAADSPYALTASQLSLYSSPTVSGPFTPVPAVFTGGNGVFQAVTTTSGSVGFYIVSCPSVAGTIVSGSAVSIDTPRDPNGGGPITNSMSNIDIGNWYQSAAFDNVGNLYGASISDSYIRAWSPPGANTNTTVAVATLTATP